MIHLLYLKTIMYHVLIITNMAIVTIFYITCKLELILSEIIHRNESLNCVTVTFSLYLT